jgi:hypothetical protein
MTRQPDDEISDKREESEGSEDDPALAQVILQTVARLIGWSGSPTELREALRSQFGRKGAAARWAKARAWLANETRRIELKGGMHGVSADSDTNRERRIITDNTDIGPKTLRFTPITNAKGKTNRGRRPRRIRPA